jgi:hypothetical protein
MSYFLITSKNTLPERFHSTVPVTDKQAIAEKLIVESFLTEANFTSAMGAFRALPVISAYRYVDGYNVTNVTFLPTQEDADALLAIIAAQRDKNSNQIGRLWTHPVDPNSLTVSSVTDAEFLDLTAQLEAKHVPATNLQFY